MLMLMPMLDDHARWPEQKNECSSVVGGINRKVRQTRWKVKAERKKKKLSSADHISDHLSLAQFSNRTTISTARITEFSIGQRLWEDTSVQQPKSIPFRRSFRLEIPKDPSLSELLECIQLSLDVCSGIISELLIPLVQVVDAGTWSNEETSGIHALVSCSDPVPIQGGGAVGHCSRPFTYYRPFVCATELTDAITDLLSMSLYVQDMSM